MKINSYTASHGSKLISIIADRAVNAIVVTVKKDKADENPLTKTFGFSQAAERRFDKISVTASWKFTELMNAIYGGKLGYTRNESLCLWAMISDLV